MPNKIFILINLNISYVFKNFRGTKYFLCCDETCFTDPSTNLNIFLFINVQKYNFQEFSRFRYNLILSEVVRF